MMSLESYAEEVRRTLTPMYGLTGVRLGLLGEIGELANLIKKQEYHGHSILREKYVEELGDCFWYATALFIRENRRTALWPAFSRPSGDTTVVDVCLCAADCAVSGGCLDVLAWLNALCDLLGVTRDECLDANVYKLRKRYPDGYSSEASVARVDRSVWRAVKAAQTAEDDFDESVK